MDSGYKQQDGLSIEAAMKKACSDCRTTKTPLWRSGPSGPKTLCNACGIRYRKKRPLPTVSSKNDQSRDKLGKSKSFKLNNAIKMNLTPFEEGTNQILDAKKQWGEVERAALLLMALSCGAAFA